MDSNPFAQFAPAAPATPTAPPSGGNPFARFAASADQPGTPDQQQWEADRAKAFGGMNKSLGITPDNEGSIVSLAPRVFRGVSQSVYDSLHPMPRTPDFDPVAEAQRKYNGLDITTNQGTLPSDPFTGMMQSRGMSPEQQQDASNLRAQYRGQKLFDLPDADFRQALNKAGLSAQEQTDLIRQRADVQTRKGMADQFGSSNPLVRLGATADAAAKTIASNAPFVGPWLNDAEGAVEGRLPGGDPEMATARNFAYDRNLNQAAPVATTLGGIGSMIAGGGIGNAMAKTATTLPERIAATAVGGPAAGLAPAATWLGRRVQNLGQGAIYGANYGAGDTEGGIDAKLAGGALGAGMGLAGAGLVDTATMAGQGIGRAASNVANPSNGAYGQILDNMGGQSIDDLARSVEVGTSGARAGTRAAALRTLGEEMQRAGGDRRVAIPATVQRLVQNGMVPSTAQDHIRELIANNSDSNLFFGEQPAVGPGNLATNGLKTATDENMRAASRIDQNGVPLIGDTIASSGGTGQAAQTVRNAFTGRQQDGRAFSRETLGAMLPNGQSLDDAQKIIDQGLQDASNDYTAAANGPQNTPVLVGGLQTAIKNAMQRLGDQGGDHATALRGAIDQLYPQIAPGAINTAQPPVRALLSKMGPVQGARAAIRGQMDAYAASDRKDIVRVLQPFYDDVTKAMTDASPMWRQANDKWAAGNIQDRALELAQNFAEKPGIANRQALADFAKAPAAIQDLTRIGYIQKLLDKLDGIGQTHDIAKLFETDGTFNNVRALFGDKQAIDFARFVRNQKVASASTRSLGNSMTQPRQARAAAADVDLNLIANAENFSAKGVRGGLVSMLVNWLRENRNRQLAKIITTPMTNVPEVAQHLEMLRRNQARLAAYDIGRRAKPMTAALSGTLGGHAAVNINRGFAAGAQ